MTGTEVSTVEKIATSQAVWAVLFIILLIIIGKFLKTHLTTLKEEATAREKDLINLYETQRLDSSKREDQLMQHLDKTTRSLEGIEKNLSGLEQKLNKSLSDIWNHLDRRQGPR